MQKNRVGTIVKRALLVFFSTLGMVLLAIVGVVYVVLCGPSESAQELLTRSLKETSAIGFIPDLYLSKERVAEIMSYRDTEVVTQETDTSLVTISAIKRASDPEDGTTDGADEGKDIEIFGITGAAYRGVMMIVKDPKRVFVGTPPSYGGYGMTLERLVERYDAIGGVNGGGYEDAGGRGTGGIPQGIVIADGVLTWGSPGTRCCISGFDENGLLHVGYMSGQEALNRKIKWACSFGPPLVVNGEGVDNGNRSGVNPRTAVGQRADGAILLLVVDGRQVTSLGATHEDLTNIMLEYGAVNASNLDGGSSTQMIYRDETLNVNTSVKGARMLPTAILVKK